MRRLVCVTLALTMVATTAAFARGPVLEPVALSGSDAALTPVPMPEPGAAPTPAAECSAPLFHCVRYKDEDEIAPCAVPMIVTVKDPCAVKDPCNPCAPPKCVAVKICVPQCTCPPKVTCKKEGEYVKFDYGKYKVQVTSKKGVVTVEYDN